MRKNKKRDLAPGGARSLLLSIPISKATI